MSTITALLTVLAFVLGSSELLIAKHDGIPGRRLGGGTRHSAPSSVSQDIDAWACWIACCRRCDRQPHGARCSWGMRPAQGWSTERGCSCFEAKRSHQHWYGCIRHQTAAIKRWQTRLLPPAIVSSGIHHHARLRKEMCAVSVSRRGVPNLALNSN